MGNEDIKRSFVNVIYAAQEQKCEDLHHEIAQLHKNDEPCPAVLELGEHIRNVREYMKKQGI